MAKRYSLSETKRVVELISELKIKFFSEEKSDYITLWEMIGRLRAEFFTLTEIAQRVGLAHSTVSRYELETISVPFWYLVCLPALCVEELEWKANDVPEIRQYLESVLQEIQQDLFDILNKATVDYGPSISGPTVRIESWEDLSRLADEYLVQRQASNVTPRQESPNKSTRTNEGKTRIPLQRPPRPLYFTGHDKEIERILADLQPGRVVTLCGPGGIGKSAIAAEIIWRLTSDNQVPERFPHGIIVYDFSTQSRTTSALDHILQSLGERSSAALEDAARRALAGRQLLLVLEGTEIAESLRQVLQIGSECSVLITTTSRKDAPDHRYQYDIRPLSIEDSVRLLQMWAGNRAENIVAARRVCHLVDRVPLALRIAGSYLREASEDIDEYLPWLSACLLDALDQGNDKSTSIPLMLERTFARVSEQGRRVLGVASLLSMVPFTVELMQKVLEWSLHEVHRALGELVAHSLLERPAKEYQFVHNLICEYARQEVPVPDDVLDRFVTMWLVPIDEIQRDPYPQGEPAIRLDKMIGVLHNLVPTFMKKEKWELVLKVVPSISAHYYQERLVMPEFYIEVNLHGLKAAQTLQNRQAELWYLMKLGRLHKQLFRPLDVAKFYEPALVIAHELGIHHAERNCLAHISMAYVHLSQDENAVRPYVRTISVSEEANDKDSLSWLMQDLALLYTYLGQDENAITYYLKAISVSEETNNKDSLSESVQGLASLYIKQNKVELATKLYMKFSSFNNEDIYIRLGDEYSSQGEMERAVEAYVQALESILKRGDRKQEAWILVKLGDVYLRTDHYEEAIYALHRLIDIAQEDYTLFDNVTQDNVDTNYFNIATSKFSDAIKWNPDNALAACVGQGIIARYRLNKDQARDHFSSARSVAQTVQEHTKIKFVLDALALFVSGDIKMAIDWLLISVPSETYN